MIKRILCLAALVVLSSTLSFAQTAGINFLLGFPMDEFRDHVKKTGFGLSLHGTFWTPSQDWPVTVGLNASYINYGNESRNSRISSDIPDVRVNVDRTYNIANMHLLFQIHPFHDYAVSPYIETLVGGAYLFTTTDINSENYSKEVASSTNFDDFAWSYGGGGGLLIRLKEFEPSEDNEISVNSLWLDIKARYMYGTEAKYLKEGSVIIENGEVFYEPVKSKTDLLTFHIGVVAYF